MWIWIIIIAVVVGALWGFLSSDDDKGGSATEGAMMGGCMAVGCLMKLALTALTIIAILWLFGALFK